MLLKDALELLSIYEISTENKISSSSRLILLSILAYENGGRTPLSCNEISTATGLDRKTVLKCIKVLREKNLVVYGDEFDSKKRCCNIFKIKWSTLEIL